MVIKPRPCLLKRNKTIVICIVIVSILFILLNLKLLDNYKKPDFWSVPDLQKFKKTMEKSLIEALKEEKGLGCNIPKMDIWSEDVIRYANNNDTVTICKGLSWVRCYYSECTVKPEILETMRNVICVYRDILSEGSKSRSLGEAVEVKGSDVYKLNISDHAYVECTARNKSNWYFSIFSSHWSGYVTGLRPITPKPSLLGRENTFNILIIGIDSASKNGFMRRLPKSYKVLTEEVNATVLNIYNIVGDSTIAAVLPILSGKRDVEHPDTRVGFSELTMDDLPLLFYKLRDDGYQTSYLEDSPWVGTFEWRYNGFKRQPTDHYLYPFLQFEFGGGIKRWLDGKYCVGDTFTYKMLLNITDQFMSLPGKRFCMTLIADISHDKFDIVTIADDDLAEFLRKIMRKRLREDTLVMVMGDHGPRFGKASKTTQGQLERRLPFMAIRLPDRLVKERPEALNSLKQNADVLTTPYDIYNTLLDVLDWRQYWNLYKLDGASLTRAMTLLEPIPRSRTCSEAGIEPHWCACISWGNVTASHPLYHRAAFYLVEYVNQQTAPYRSVCARRSLSTINWVVVQQTKPGVLNYKMSKDADGYVGYFPKNIKPSTEVYKLMVTTTPGKAVFEGTITYFTESDKFVTKVGDITRNDAYGEEPSCISDRYPHLAMFCYCVTQKDASLKALTGITHVTSV